jgi:hypothetical protein
MGVLFLLNGINFTYYITLVRYMSIYYLHGIHITSSNVLVKISFLGQGPTGHIGGGPGMILGIGC